MEKIKIFKCKVEKVGVYKGHGIFTSNIEPKEYVASMNPAGDISINPEAYEILKDRPDYLERIYEHEIGAGAFHDPHECEDKDILFYLKDKGYDFGDFKFE